MAVERSQKEVWRMTPWLLLVLLLGNFILMAYDARADDEQRVIRVWTLAAANFVQSPITYAGSAVNNFFVYLANLRSAETENEKLQKKIQELEVEVQENKELAVENKRLKSLLDLKQKSEYKILTAQIIGRDPSAWFNAAVINRGSIDGVKLNMPIVVDGGLVGRVTAVSPLNSQINLITADKAGLGAIIGELGSSNALGVVRGKGEKGRLEMDYVPGYVPVAKGDIVYTTGQGGVYPPGLKLGEIEEVRTGSATMPHQIFIRQTARISSMQEVAILLYTPPPRPKYEKALPNAVKKEEMANSNTDSED
ncbi:MAG: rod shape-determining protein MreC [Pyrinomonadaceae bacterium]|nr:rod shape-determining protein MreC [Pyrinomonadaceae bacterium]